MLSRARCTHKKQPCERGLARDIPTHQTRQSAYRVLGPRFGAETLAHRLSILGGAHEPSEVGPWILRAPHMHFQQNPSWWSATQTLSICLLFCLLPQGRLKTQPPLEPPLQLAVNQPPDPGKKMKEKQPGPWPPPCSGQESQHCLGAWSKCSISGSTPDLRI